MLAILHRIKCTKCQLLHIEVNMNMMTTLMNSIQFINQSKLNIYSFKQVDNSI